MGEHPTLGRIPAPIEGALRAVNRARGGWELGRAMVDLERACACERDPRWFDVWWEAQAVIYGMFRLFTWASNSA